MRLLVLLLAVLATGCAHYNPELYNSSLAASYQNASRHLEAGRKAEAAYLYHEIQQIDPAGDAGAQLAGLLAAQPELGTAFKSTMLGVNKSMRYGNTEAGLAGKVAMYFPNRLMDLLDMFTVQAGVGAGFGIRVRATSALAYGLKGSLGQLMVGMNNRHLSMIAELDNSVHVLPFAAYSNLFAEGYTGGLRAGMFNEAGIQNPSDEIFQRKTDYWALEIDMLLAVVALRLEFHPVELVDFFAGWAGIDFLTDDLYVSKGLDLERQDLIDLRTLGEQRYLRDKAQPEGAAGPVGPGAGSGGQDGFS